MKEVNPEADQDVVVKKQPENSIYEGTEESSCQDRI